MSEREWKPGGVAALTFFDEVAIGVRNSTNTGWRHSSAWACGSLADFVPHVARPLVVIDPEDREQVERLRNALFGRSAHAHGVKEMQTVLREFADPKPPKPVWADGDAVQVGENGIVWIRGTAAWTNRGDYVIDEHLKDGTYRLIRRQSDGAGA